MRPRVPDSNVERDSSRSAFRPSVPDVHMSDARDAELSTYRPVTWEAVLGLIVGLASPLALVDWFLWAVPAVGLLLSWRALRRIARDPSALAGRKMALVGLILSLGFGAAAPSDWLVYRWNACREARGFAEAFFRYIAQDEPQKAFQFLLPGAQRQPLDNQLWGFYNHNEKMRKGLEGFVRPSTAESPNVPRVLLALGPKATVRFYQTVEQDRMDDKTYKVVQLFAVSYDDDGEKKSFFVKVAMIRERVPPDGVAWRIFGVEGGVQPEGWK
jgi:hypothetical protein